MFSIRFGDEDLFVAEFGRGVGTPHRFVLTALGDYEGRIAAPLSIWSEADYEAQWRDGAQRLLSGAESSCIIKRMEDPASDDQVVDWWELYRVEGDSVVVRSRAWWAPNSGGPLDPASIYDAVLPFTTSHEGLPPLEWHLEMRDLADWLTATPA